MVGFVEVTKEDKNDQNDREYASFIREKKEACGGKGRGTANTKSKKKNSCNGKAKKKNEPWRRSGVEHQYSYIEVERGGTLIYIYICF